MNGESKGIVKWFDARKGFGFITSDEDRKDYFIHYSGIHSNNGEYKILREGERVSFRIEPSSRGEKAVDVRLLIPSQETLANVGTGEAKDGAEK